MAESDELMERLRDHVGRGVVHCRNCDPTNAVYCRRVERDAAEFAERRYEEVLAGRLARRVGVVEAGR